MKTLPPGEPVSYGGLFETKNLNGTKIATLPLGYADGYRRLLGSVAPPSEDPRGKWFVLIKGASSGARLLNADLLQVKSCPW